MTEKELRKLYMPRVFENVPSQPQSDDEVNTATYCTGEDDDCDELYETLAHFENPPLLDKERSTTGTDSDATKGTTEGGTPSKTTSAVNVPGTERNGVHANTSSPCVLQDAVDRMGLVKVCCLSDKGDEVGTATLSTTAGGPHGNKQEMRRVLHGHNLNDYTDKYGMVVVVTKVTIAGTCKNEPNHGPHIGSDDRPDCLSDLKQHGFYAWPVLSMKVIE